MLRTLDFAGGWRRLGLALALVSLFPVIGAADSAKDNWTKRLVAQLNAQRRYPLQAADQGGTAKVVFHIDRDGHLISVALTKTTGDPVLDEEALAMVQRAQPFAPPPPEVPEDDVTLLLPVVFAPRRTSGIMKLDETKLKFEDTTPSGAALKARLNGVCRGC